MLKNYFTIAIRNIFKHKVYSILNITGLALGLACSIFILLWVQDELSFDRHFDNADNLYRVEEDQNYSGENYHVNVTPYPSAPVFITDIPEVENATRWTWHSSLLRNGENAFYENSIVAVDSNYFDMFSVEFVYGNASKVLTEPHTIVLNEDLAEKYFGNINPVGQTLSMDNKYEFKVVGVIKKFPPNTSFQFKGAIPFDFLKEVEIYSDSWGNNSISTFVQLNPSSDLNAVGQKMTDLLVKNNPETRTIFNVAPITGLHLYSYWGYGKPDGAIQYVYIFSVIALFILLIACINFMNLSTARSSNRAKEIGMRKVVGAKRINLIYQFFGESMILSIIGMLLALVIVALLLSPFNNLTGKEISLAIFLNWEFILGFLFITLFTGFVAGGYPALYLSGFRPVKVLRGSFKAGSKNAAFRKVLVVFQFSLSVFLIIGTIVIYNQLIYMQEKGLGYDKEHVLYVYLRGNLKDNYESLKNELRSTSGVFNVTGSNHQPHMIGSNSGGSDWDGKDPEQTVLIGTHVVDYDYCKTLKIELATGRYFSEDYSMDLVIDSTGNFLVNEEVAKAMGKDNASVIGERFRFMGIEGEIIGVMKNFHFSSVQNEIGPLAMLLYPKGVSYLVIRIAPGKISETMDNIEETWASVVPSYPLEYKFIDEEFQRQYQTEKRMVTLLEYFSAMAILIACLGLFGLASFTAEQRKKEIGIRKVLGANEYTLTYLLCKEFMILIAVSAIVAWPIAYFILTDFLEKYAYHINLGWATFLISGIITLFVALITVGYQALKAALANPITTIRYE